ERDVLADLLETLTVSRVPGRRVLERELDGLARQGREPRHQRPQLKAFFVSILVRESYPGDDRRSERDDERDHRDERGDVLVPGTRELEPLRLDARDFVLQDVDFRRDRHARALPALYTAAIAASRAASATTVSAVLRIAPVSLPIGTLRRCR